MLAFLLLLFGGMGYCTFLMRQYTNVLKFQNQTVRFVDSQNNFKRKNSFYTHSHENHQGEQIELTEKFSFYDWKANEQLFIQLALNEAYNKLNKTETLVCVLSNTTSYPRDDIYTGTGLVYFEGLLTSPYQDLLSLSARHQSKYYYLVDIPNSSENKTTTIAQAVFSHSGTIAKQLGVDIPVFIYIDKNNLQVYMKAGKFLEYGAVLVHEDLHQYNHAHPGNTFDEKYNNTMFINVVERCILS